MTTSIHDGPGGLECKHTVNGLILGDQAATPRYKLDRITGIHSLPETDDDRRPRTAFLGEVTYPSYPRGKTVVYEGRIQATTLDNMRRMANNLRAACSERSVEQQVLITPHSSWGSDDWGYYARVLQLDLDDEQITSPYHARGPYQRGFVLGLRMSDPRFYWKLNASAGVQQSIGNANNSQQSLVNGGTAPSDPLFDVVVGTGNPNVEITNIDVMTSNGTARLRFNAVPSSTLQVNFFTRTVTLNGNDAFKYFDTVYNQWWDELIPGFRPGTNRINVTGCVSWNVHWWHRSW